MEHFLRNILGEEYKVNSFHHQIVKDVAPGLRLLQKVLMELLNLLKKLQEDCFVVGVQWHPEMLSTKHLDSQRIFDEFIKNVEERKNK